MSDVFLYIYFIFKSTKMLPYFSTSTQHFTGMPEYTKHMLLNTLHVFYNNNLHPFSIFYTISIFCFPNCVQVNALPENIPYLLSTLYLKAHNQAKYIGLSEDHENYVTYIYNMRGESRTYARNKMSGVNII